MELKIENGELSAEGWYLRLDLFKSVEYLFCR